MLLFFDTETTGLYPGQICQLSYVMQSANGVKAKNFFFTVDDMEYGAFQVHGFSAEKLFELSHGARFSDRVKEIEKDFLSASVIISHNADFDCSFMRAEFERLNRVFIVNDSFCSMKNSVAMCKLKRKHGEGYKYPKLSELCAFLNLTDEKIKKASIDLFGADASFHDARFDTAAVYLAVNKCFEINGAFGALRSFL